MVQVVVLHQIQIQFVIKVIYPISRPIYINIENINFAANDAIYQFVKFFFTPYGQSLFKRYTLCFING